MTIASCVETDTDLDGLEARHICPERALAELFDMEKSKMAQESQGSANHTS
jgi:hypothetical protein